MGADQNPPPVQVTEVDLEKQVHIQETSTDLKDKKKDAGVIVTVTALGADSTFVTPAVTPATSTLDLTVLPASGEDEVFPEGGLRAWLVVFGGWCGLFGSMG